MASVGIFSAGHYIPSKILTNTDLIQLGLDTSHEWIVERTGIEKRHIAENETSADMGAKAALLAIKNAGICAEDIDLIIVATSTPAYASFPSNACLIQNQLGLHGIPAFDISAACTGFSYALTTASHYVSSGMSQKALVIATDRLSQILDWTDRSTCILFGDGAGAVILSKTEPGYGILSSVLHADGGQASILCVEDQHIKMNGKAVFKTAIDFLVPAVLEALEKATLSIKDITWFIPHQANLRIIHHAQEKLGLTPEQVLVHIQRYGNMSAASIPVVLSETLEEGKIKKGDIVVMVGFGAGFTWGVSVIKWS